jgi:hypothetical protein
MKILMRAISKREEIGPSAVVEVDVERFRRIRAVRDDFALLKMKHQGLVERIGISDVTVTFYDAQSDALDVEESFVIDNDRELPWDMGEEIRTDNHVLYVTEYYFWWTADGKYGDDHLESMAFSWEDYDCPLHGGDDQARIVCLRCAAELPPAWPPRDDVEEETDDGEEEPSKAEST